MHGRVRQAWCLAALMCGFLGEAAAEVGVDFGIERFRWREFRGGERLLEESGPRYRVGAQWRQPLDAGSRRLLQLRGAVYFGRVDYDGLSQDLNTGDTAPFRTDADYLGATLEAALVGRFDGFDHEYFGGAGIDAWKRSVRARDGVRGVAEYWNVFYLLGGVAAVWHDEAVRYRLGAGAKYPFYTYEAADFDLALEPKGRLSWFARLTADFGPAHEPHWGIGLYYDRYRFAQSDAEVAFVPGVGPTAFGQPESEQDVIGIRAVFYLN